MLKYLYAFLLIFFMQNAKSQTIDSCKFYKMQRDTLLHKNYVANKKIAKLVFYENLCIKKPSQIKFLKGWQQRTVRTK